MHRMGSVRGRDLTLMNHMACLLDWATYDVLIGTFRVLLKDHLGGGASASRAKAVVLMRYEYNKGYSQRRLLLPPQNLILS